MNICYSIIAILGAVWIIGTTLLVVEHDRRLKVLEITNQAHLDAMTQHLRGHIEEWEREQEKDAN